MCMYVHVCAVHTQPLAPPVCVWAIPAPPPTPFSRGEGTEGNQRGNRRGREPGVLIQTHRRARRGGHEVTRHLHHTQTPAPSLAAAVATATRGAQSIPGYCQPLLLPLCCRGPGCPREREKCRDCPCHSDPPNLQAALTGELPAPPGAWAVPPGAATFPCGVTADPCNGICLCVGALLGARGTMVQPQSELTGHHHCPPTLAKVRATQGSSPMWPTQTHAHIVTGLVLSHMWQGYPKGATSCHHSSLPPGCPSQRAPSLLRKWLLEKPQAIKNS